MLPLQPVTVRKIERDEVIPASIIELYFVIFLELKVANDRDLDEVGGALMSLLQASENMFGVF